jgi:hypothetical protein
MDKMKHGQIRGFWLPLGFSLFLAAGWLTPLWAAEEQKKSTSPPKVVEGEIQLEKAEEPCPPKEEKEECPTTFGPIITDTAIPIDKGKFAVQPTFGLGFVTHNLTQSWRRVSAGGNFQSFGMDWKFTYGLWNNLEVFVVIPYVHNWASNVSPVGPNGERAADFGGLGDINLTFKYRLVEETEVKPTVTALFATGFPTGHYRKLSPMHLGVDQIGGGAYAFTTGLNLSKWVKPFIFYANFWYSMQTAFSTRGEDEDGNSFYSRNYPRDYVTVNLAAEYPITKKWVALLELTSYWDGGRLFGHQANVPPGALLSVMPGIEYMATEKFSLALGVNVSLVGKNTAATVTPLLSMVYAF